MVPPPTEHRHRCEFADVWKGQYHDQEVAVKVLRVCSTKDSQWIREVGC